MIRAMQQFCDLGLDDLGALVNVRGGGAQEGEAGFDEEVLPAVVLDQSFPVVGSVVLDDEARLVVVEIGAADEPAPGVVQVGLDFGSGQPGLQE